VVRWGESEHASLRLEHPRAPNLTLLADGNLSSDSVSCRSRCHLAETPRNVAAPHTHVEDDMRLDAAIGDELRWVEAGAVIISTLN
jgi:hypothetical protein